MALNQTQIPGLPEITQQYTPSDVQNNSFSRANVFGLFLTLNLCLLAQPFGSLLYDQPSSAFGRALFFFWRLNPLACAMEAFSLIICLLHGVWMTHKTRNTSTANSIDFWKRLQLTAMGVMLLRGHGRSPDHIKVARNGGGQQPGTIQFPRRAARAYTRQSHCEDRSLTLLPLRDINADSCFYEAPLRNIGAADRESVVANAFLQRNPSESETFRTVAISRFSESALGQYALTHIDDLIDSINTFAVVLVIVKLAAVTIPWYICLPAWLIVTSWVAVQTVTLISRRCHVENIDPVYSIHCVDIIGRNPDDSIPPILWSTLVLLLSSVAVFALVYIDSILDIEEYTFFISQIFFSLFYIPCTVEDDLIRPKANHLRTESTGSSSIDSDDKHKSSVKSITADLISFGLSIFVFLGNHGLTGHEKFDRLDPWWRYLYAAYISFPFLRHMGLGSCRGWGTELTRGFVLFWNLSMAIVSFVAAMVVYDDSETYKPGWIEWLG